MRTGSFFAGKGNGRGKGLFPFFPSIAPRPIFLSPHIEKFSSPDLPAATREILNMEGFEEGGGYEDRTTIFIPGCPAN
jgi:hypothetical protein